MRLEKRLLQKIDSIAVRCRRKRSYIIREILWDRIIMHYSQGEKEDGNCDGKKSVKRS